MPDATYNLGDAPKLGAIKNLLTRIKTKLDSLENAVDETAIRAVATDGNTVKFYTSSDTSATSTSLAYSFDFPEELFLDQAGTTLVENFTFSALSYPNTTNPNLDGKTVLVLAVKGDAQTPTVKYSFVNLEKLIDRYTASDTSIVISDYNVKVNIASDTGNLLSLRATGLYVDSSTLMGKVTTSTAGNIAIFGSDGSVVDSGSKFCTDAEFNAMLDEVFPTVNGGGA